MVRVCMHAPRMSPRQCKPPGARSFRTGKDIAQETPVFGPGTYLAVGVPVFRLDAHIAQETPCLQAGEWVICQPSGGVQPAFPAEPS